MAKGSHLFPYRTQKLSLSAPMVLGWRRPGRVGRCRIPYEKASDECLGLFHIQSTRLYYPAIPANVQRSTWDRSLPPPVEETGRRSVVNRKERIMRVPRIGEAWAASSGRNKAHAERPGADTAEKQFSFCCGLLSRAPYASTCLGEPMEEHRECLLRNRTCWALFAYMETMI